MPLSCAALAAALATSAPIVPEGWSPELDLHMDRQGRQFYEINALPFGLSLDAQAPPEWRDVIRDWLADEEAPPLEEFAGQHPFTFLGPYGEHGDLGMFGGVAVAATAYEYRVLKRDGADPERLARARERVVRAAESWHVFYEVTGGGGVVARGILRLVPEDPGDPPIPNPDRELIPLFDGEGNPLPPVKTNGEYRADNSGGTLPADTWIWADSCSKDQLVGQVFGLVLLHDAMKDDPDIDPALVLRMAEDAKLVGARLRDVWDVATIGGVAGEGLYDLVIPDADGRPTFFHDLNPYAVDAALYLDPDGGVFYRFNLLMAIGVLKGLHHVSGDPAIESFLYEELLDGRAFLEMVNREEGAIDTVYAGILTNFSNVNMIATALWLGILLENDPQVTAELRTYLETMWWDRPDEPHRAKDVMMPFYTAVYLTLTDRGTDPALVEATRDLLLAWDLGPYEDPDRINCDEDEIEAGKCLAVDGKTELVIAGLDRSDQLVATAPLHPTIRQPSNFDARSNPFRVNGGGGDRLNPGGDLLAAYWILRWFEALPPGDVHVSPFARVHMAVGGGAPNLPEPDPAPEPEPTPGPGADAAASDAAGADTADSPPQKVSIGRDDGCAGSPAGAAWPISFLLAAAVATRRRRRS